MALLAAVTPTGLAIDPKSPVSSYRRTTFTTEDGLAANVINDILQPRDGSLWIATYNGLTRFDGQHFTHVPFPKLLINVYSMTEGPDGDLWLGTRAGVFRISPRLDLARHIAVWRKANVQRTAVAWIVVRLAPSVWESGTMPERRAG